MKKPIMLCALGGLIAVLSVVFYSTMDLSVLVIQIASGLGIVLIGIGVFLAAKNTKGK